MRHSMFDFNGDGELDIVERAAEYEFLESFLDDDKDDSDTYSFYDDDEDELEAAGLDRDELELMDDDERREALEDAGFDIDDFDF